MLSINKELLFARLSYLNEITIKPGTKDVNPQVSEKVKELIEKGEIASYMALESVYHYLEEMSQENAAHMDEYANEIISFIN